ncbi:hypothetical protein GCM10027052_22090 [Parafrigoribacterium mesophilum]
MIHQAEDAKTEANRPGVSIDGDQPLRPGSEPAKPWLAPIAEAAAAAVISLEAAEAIRIGLGEPSTDITELTLTDAAARLVELAKTLNVDELANRARALRDDLDEAGIAEREAERRQRRSLRVFLQPDGMTKLVWLLDPESAAIVTATYDQLTSPRRGGPRFVDPAEQSRADAITSDPRTTEQLAHDGFLQLLTIGADAAPDSVIGTNRPAVRVLVTEQSLREGAGHGRIEGQLDPVSIATVQRALCDTGVQPIVFDDAEQPLNVGRAQRRFNKRQRIALATRDGGCMWPGCNRPVSWTEAHHINEWNRDHGNTDVIDGILLCRHHHMLLHDNGWRITRSGARYWLIPPRLQDPSQTPLAMPFKSAALADLVRESSTRAKRRTVIEPSG